MKYQLSIIIPVLNETYIINRLLKHLYKLHFNSTFEIIIVDGDGNGSTINSIMVPDVKKVISTRGRGAQMNRGASVARGEIFLFLHADSILAENALDQILATCKRKDVVAGAFSLGIDSRKKTYRLIEAGVSLRSHFTKIPYGDQAIFLKKEIFFQLGGFKVIPLMEDVEFMQRVKKTEGTVSILPAKVWTSARRWEKEGAVVCTLRNWTLITLYLLGVSPERLAKFYR
jgi:rSAM/selenodomain-associated transferase 2